MSTEVLGWVGAALAGSRPRTWPGHDVWVEPDVRVEATDRAAEQTAAYGHDRGYFSLGRSLSSHEIGCLGEVVARDFLRRAFAGSGHVAIELTGIGAPVDLDVQVEGKLTGLHVKTGQYRQWPSLDQPFGVHFGQRLEMTGLGLILVSLIASDTTRARVEGMMTAEVLASCPIIRRGEQFPNRPYTSRTDNRLTFVEQYMPVTAEAVRKLLR